MKKGFATTLIILAAWMLSMMFLLIGFSRLSLSIERGVSFSDKVISAFDTESAVNDEVSRYINSYPAFNSKVVTFADNTKLTINAGPNDITALGQRNWAATKINLKKSSSSILTPWTDVDLIFVLDCSGTMGNPACSDGSCAGTRMDHLKSDVLSFLNKINSLPYKDHIYIGINMFTLMSDWMKTNSGVEIRPENKVPVADVIAAVNTQLDHDGVNGANTSAACIRLTAGTNIGGGMMAANRSLKSINNASEKHRKIEILFTDGEVNSTTPDVDCVGVSMCPHEAISNTCCPAGSNCGKVNVLNGNANWVCLPEAYVPGGCDKYALDYTSCGVMKESQTFTPEQLSGVHSGLRGNDVELYSVILSDPVSAKISTFYGDNSTKYYNIQNAGQLNAILDTIYNVISPSVTVFTFTSLWK